MPSSRTQQTIYAIWKLCKHCLITWLSCCFISTLFPSKWKIFIVLWVSIWCLRNIKFFKLVWKERFGSQRGKYILFLITEGHATCWGQIIKFKFRWLIWPFLFTLCHLWKFLLEDFSDLTYFSDCKTRQDKTRQDYFILPG